MIFKFSTTKKKNSERVNLGNIEEYKCSDYIPFWLSVKESTRGVYVHHLTVCQGAVTLLGVLLGRVTEISTQNGLLDPRC